METATARFSVTTGEGHEFLSTIENFVGQSIMPTGIDHFCVTVESVDQVMEDIDDLVGRNPVMHTIPLGMGPEGRARLELAHKQCPLAERFICDPDYNLIALRAG